MNRTYQTFLQEIRERSLLGSIHGLLNWDRETYMPPQSLEGRAEQCQLLSKLSHERLIDPKFQELIAQLTEPAAWKTLTDTEQVNVRETKRAQEKAVKIPTRLVEELTRATTMAHEKWVEARKQDSFETFAPNLKKIIELNMEMAHCLGFKDPYDALLDDYEPGATVAELTPLFADLKKELVPLIPQIQEKQKKFQSFVLKGPFPIEKQKELGHWLLEKIGFDFQHGRLDTTVHPFCMGMPGDVRLTTRYDEENFKDCFYSVFHEGGHGLYEQGLAPQHRHTPMGAACSMGVHESQSRLWENLVGRSASFVSYLLPKLKETFPQNFAHVSEEEFYYWVNKVHPSLIRTEADEVTYNLHVILRFELEKGLIRGDFKITELPSLWNEKMKEYLGITPPNNRLGVLQDVHWSAGLFGYFPTYALGNLYAAQFFHQIQKDLPSLQAEIAAGELQNLREWLRKNIHTHGQHYRAGELCEQVTKEPLRHHYFLDYLKKKFNLASQ
ncbi:MAG: carboxypeptidase M32 [Deltaproteobacteria bacterium]|nr:carboxypeptidase M32 [Deltaproteobacteria bacterium]